MHEQTEKNSILKNPAVVGVLSYIVAILIAFIASGIFIKAMGFDVIPAFKTILFTSFRTNNGIVQTLVKFSTLTLMALAFAIPYATMKFNIGGEGQLLMGATGAAAVGILLVDLPMILLLPLVLLAGLIAGALWGLIPALLLYRFNINEILTTVVLNFVALAFVNFVASEVWEDPVAGHPTTVPIGEGGFLPLLADNPPLHIGIILVILIAVGVYIYIKRSTAGYDLIATGANPRAAFVYGINTRIMFALALVLGGAMAGLAGAVEVAGVHHRLIEGVQARYQVLGIIIGIIAKGNPIAVPFVALFIAILEVGASAMQRTMMIPVEMVFIVEALIVILVLLSDVVRRRK
jgi:general nucleoside transport system permease protein